MYLSKVEILGFKSFAQKTTLYLHDGIAAIVGPNGCGKTNIVDAIRWALGEQKTSVLRSDVMENVIFNGSRSRRALGMAEVSVTIQNNKNILPTEYSEVVITRRLFRDGESQYQLNKTNCRLRDITDLFMDTGMGAGAYSVIELKMIESILSDKAEERRHLFEEAAGITKYKSRRKETQKRLEALQADVTRASDIVFEVQKNVGTLGRQADKARQYNNIKLKLEELEVQLMRYELRSLVTSIAEEEQSSAELTTRLESLEQTVEREDRELATLLSQKDAVSETMRGFQDQENARRKELAHVQRTRAVSEERLRANVSTIQRLNAEIARALARRGDLEKNASLAHQERESLLTRLSELHAAEPLDEGRRSALVTSLDEVRNQVRTADTLYQERQRETASVRATLHQLEQRRAGLERRVADLRAESNNLAARSTDLAKSKSNAQAKRDDVDQRLHEATALLEKGVDDEKRIRSEIDTANHTVSDKKAARAHAQASIEFLSSLIDTSATGQHLRTSTSWRPVSGKATLAELLFADDAYLIAIESALGEAGSYFVVDSIEEAREGIHDLQQSGKGKATFLCRNHIPQTADFGPAPQCDGVFGWLPDLVNCEDVLRHAVRLFAGKTVLVDTEAAALRCIGEFGVDMAVTLAGQTFRRAGSIKGGSTSKTEGMAVGRSERMKRLTSQRDTLDAEIDATSGHIATQRRLLASLDIEGLRSKIRILEKERQTVIQTVQQLEYQGQSLADQRASNEQNLERVGTEIADLLSSIESTRLRLQELESQILSQQNVVQALRQQRQEVETALAKFDEALRRFQVDEARINAGLESATRSIASTEDSLRMLAQQHEQWQTEVQALEREDQTVKEEITAIRSQESEIQAQIDAVTKKIDDARAEANTITRHYNDKSITHKTNRSALDEARRKAQEHTIRLADMLAKRQTILEQAAEHHNLQEEDIMSPPQENFDFGGSKASIQTLRNRLQNLGNVNFLALEEFDQESVRLSFLETQLKDLREAESALTETIREINETARQQFRETFEKIHTSFKELFVVLFGGGEAELQLDDGDPLDALINISAKPPGKKPTSIELLSAGEKTLTAIALLFAIYLVKPSPFCILDEVDAPLDDANIDRYLNLITRFSSNTQFLMITHNKKTMEAAATLYGVTQQEEGISQLVAAKLSGVPRTAAVEEPNEIAAQEALA